MRHNHSNSRERIPRLVTLSSSLGNLGMFWTECEIKCAIRRLSGQALVATTLGTMALWLGAASCAGETVLYSAQFESTEGYNPKLELAGQQGWVSYGAASGGNGFTTNFFGSQAAYVGRTPLKPPGEFLNLWRPINYTPAQGESSLVRFTVEMAIGDSSNKNWDDFYWSVYNIEGDRLFTIDFDNYGLSVYYVLGGTNYFVPTQLSFTNGIPYTLAINMDFASNRWDARLSGQLLATNQPISTTNAPLDLGDVDAVWAIYNVNAPGNNYMAFDNYKISTVPVQGPPPRLSVLAYAQGSPALRVSGISGAHYAIEASTNMVDWLPIRTNIVSGGYFDFIDTSGSQFSRRFYRALQVN